MTENPFESVYAMRILVSLHEKPKRFSDLSMDARINTSPLTRRLKQLQNLGLIQSKKLGKTKREGVLYSLTEKGEMLFPHLLELYKILKKLEMEV